MRTLLILFLALPLSAAPIFFGPEAPVTGPEYANLVGQRSARIAANGDVSLAVWWDLRGGEPRVYGARFDAAGALLDPVGIFIGRGTAGDVIWTGGSFLVAFTPAGDVRAAVRSVGADGTLGELREVPAVYNHTGLELATNGRNVLLAGTRYAALLDLDGGTLETLDTSLFSITSVASNGSDYVIAIAMSNGVLVQHVSGSGVLSAPVAIANTPNTYAVAVASDGTGYMVLWAADDLYARRIDSNSQPAGTTQTLGAELTPVNISDARAQMVWHNGEYIALLARGENGTMARLSPAGEPLSTPDVFARIDPFGGVDITNAGNSAAVVWVDADRGVRAGLLEAALPFRTITNISRAAQPQRGPALANAGGTLVTAWVEKIGTAEEIRIQRDGGSPIVVAAALNHGASSYATNVDVVYDGTWVWVVWLDDRLNVRRYTAALAPVDAATTGFQIPRQPRASWTVAAGERGILVAARGNGANALVALTMRGDDAGIVATGEVLAVDEQDAGPDVRAAAWDGTVWTVAWTRVRGTYSFHPPFGPYDFDVRAVRVARDGVRIDPEPIVVQRAGDARIDSLRAARAPGGVLLAWTTPAGIHATIFRGSPEPTVRLVKSWPGRTTLDELLPAANGGWYFFWSSQTQIHVDRITADLTTIADSATLPLFTDYGAALLAGDPVLTYARVAPEPQYGGVTRLFTRRGGTVKRRAVR